MRPSLNLHAEVPRDRVNLNWSGYRESNPDRKLGRLSSDLRYPQLRVFPRCQPKTIPASTPLCIDLAVSVSRHPGSTVRSGCTGCRCFSVALHYRLISVQAFPRAALATGETTDSFCGSANPWRHRDANTRRCVDGARSRSRQLGVRPPPMPFWRAPADCFWLSASRAPPAGLIRGNKKPGTVAGFRSSVLHTQE